MPEYLAPGVFVEETSFRHKPIEGVSTSTTGFVGPTRDGPIFVEPPLITSFQEFEQIYGGMDPLEYDGVPFTNYLAHAVRAYFEEGGKRLYIARAYDAPNAEADPPDLTGQGIASWSIDDEASLPGSPPDQITIRSRYPGAAGNRLVTFRFRLGPNVLSSAGALTLRGAQRFDVAWVQTRLEADASPPQPGQLYWVDRFFDPQGQPTFRLRRDNPQSAPDPGSITDLSTLAQVRLLSVGVSVEGRGRFRGRFERPRVYEDLTFHPGTLGPGARRTLTEELAAAPVRRSTELQVPIVFETSLPNGALVAELLAQRQARSNDGRRVIDALSDLMNPASIVTDDQLTMVVELRGGSDGRLPDAGEFQGREQDGRKGGLLAFEDLEDISILAAPGSSHASYGPSAGAVARALLSHAERMRYRVAVIDAGDGLLPGEALEQRGSLDSKHGAYYYPWVRVFDPVSETEINLPPSGFVAGIYARNDVERGVHKAPANEVVRLATGLEFLVNARQQEALNPQGVNCLRYFEGRGYRVWGARALTTDGEWKYVNLRRNFAYLGRSIELSTQWAVFEPNSELLWGNVRRSAEDFLYGEWKNRRLMGVNPAEAFFVRCDRTTMTQADIDNGRLVCLIGVALLRPAEFVIFRIGQKTLDFKTQ